MEALVSSIPMGTFFARMFSSNEAKQLASAALQVGKTAAKGIAMKAIDVRKTVALDAGKQLAENAAKKYPHPSSKLLFAMVSPEEITKQLTNL